MSAKCNLIINVKNLANSQFPILQKESLFKLEECIANQNGLHSFINELTELDYEECLDLINKFSSIPDYANSICKEKFSNFDLNSFLSILITDMFTYLSLKHSDKYMEICANILSSLFIKGHWTKICEYLNLLDKKSNHLVLFGSLLNHVPVKHFDSFLLRLICSIKSNSSMKYLINNLVNPNLLPKLLFICQKMLFFQFYQSEYIAINLNILISKLPVKDQIMLLTEILVLWSDDNSIIKITFDQHFYLSKMLLLMFFQFSLEIKESFFSGDNLSLLLKGISLHLMQPMKNYSLIGMVIAELLSTYCSFKSEKPLNFEYVDTEETKILKNLIKIHVPDIKFNENLCELDRKNLDEPVDSSIDNCSDDNDFETIKTVFDDENINCKRPYYVRDCFEGLSKTKPEDIDYFIKCLDSAENLIYNCPEASIEESIEFSRLLLHLHVEFEVEDFTNKQRNGLVALCALDPIRVSKYLSEEFFNEHNSIGVRYNILQIFTKTSQKLSGFDDFLQVSVPQPTVGLSSTKNSEITKGKTRYFFSRNRKPLVESKNLFNDFCNHFFYPLLAGVTQNKGFDILNYDFDLLSRYIYTLGIIVYCSVHSVSVAGLMKEYFLFLKSLRIHDRVCVRQAVQVCLGICLIGLSSVSAAVIDELVECLTDWQIWLRTANELFTFELDPNCSSLIEKNLFLMRDLIVNSASLLLGV